MGAFGGSPPEPSRLSADDGRATRGRRRRGAGRGRGTDRPTLTLDLELVGVRRHERADFIRRPEQALELVGVERDREPPEAVDRHRPLVRHLAGELPLRPVGLGLEGGVVRHEGSELGLESFDGDVRHGGIPCPAEGSATG